MPRKSETCPDWGAIRSPFHNYYLQATQMRRSNPLCSDNLLSTYRITAEFTVVRRRAPGTRHVDYDAGRRSAAGSGRTERTHSTRSTNPPSPATAHRFQRRTLLPDAPPGFRRDSIPRTPANSTGRPLPARRSKAFKP